MLPIVGSAAMAATVTMPSTATITSTTYEVSENGQTTIVNQVTGTFVRASDGSELRLMLDPKTHQPSTAIVRANDQDVSMSTSASHTR